MGSLWVVWDAVQSPIGCRISAMQCSRWNVDVRVDLNRSPNVFKYIAGIVGCFDFVCGMCVVQSSRRLHRRGSRSERLLSYIPHIPHHVRKSVDYEFVRSAEQSNSYEYNQHEGHPKSLSNPIRMKTASTNFTQSD